MNNQEKMSAIQKKDWVRKCVVDIDDENSEVVQMLDLFPEKHQLYQQGDAKIEAISKLLIANAVENWIDPSRCASIALKAHDLAIFEVVARTVCIEMKKEKERILMELMMAEYLQNILGSDISISHLSSTNH